MIGFDWDSDAVYTDAHQLMGSYNRSNLTALYGLAEQLTVACWWFCYVPTLYRDWREMAKDLL